MRNLFFKSLTLRFNQEKGFKITKNSLTLKNQAKELNTVKFIKLLVKFLKMIKKVIAY